LFNAAYRGAQIANMKLTACKSPEGLDKWVADASDLMDDFNVVGVLRGLCLRVTETAEFSDLSPDDQATVWRAVGILDVANLMPTFWAEGLACCAIDAFDDDETDDEATPQPFHLGELDDLLSGLIN
jgi:hypothetical protein